jgi:hypothetical protein
MSALLEEPPFASDYRTDASHDVSFNLPRERSTIFGPIVPYQPVVVLIMIENSHYMMSVWPQIRHEFIPMLLGALRAANPVVPVGLSFFTSIFLPRLSLFP